VLLNYAQLGEVLQRRPDGLRITLLRCQGEWAREIGAARVRIGRRVLFDTEQIARLIDEHRGRMLVVVITFGGFWLFTPSPDEMSRLRTEQQQLQTSIDLLASRGGRAYLRRCGAANDHLCVRVEPKLGRFGDEKDLYVIRGY
jgi:hypothetical protein